MRTDSKPRLLCAAEPWGFGPAAALMAIVTGLKRTVHCVFAGTGSALDLARQSPNIFDEVIELGAISEILGLRTRADRVLSVMDPGGALWAVRNGVPCTYVDIMSWAWKWDEVDWSLLCRRAAEWRSPAAAELLSASDVDPVFLGYIWSDEVFTQRFDHPTLKPTPRVAVRSVGAIIQLAHGGGQDCGNDPSALVSLSGSLSPLLNLALARHYLRVVSEILKPSRDLLGTDTIVVNPRLAPDAIALGWRAQSLSYDGYRDALARCSFLLCPVGLGSAFEAAAHGVPVVFLPEQHNLQIPIYQAFARDCPDDFPELFLASAAEPGMEQQEAIRLIEARQQQLLRDPGRDRLRFLQERLRRLAEMLQSPDVRQRIAERQRGGIVGAVGDLKGSDAIAAHLSAVMLSRVSPNALKPGCD